MSRGARLHGCRKYGPRSGRRSQVEARALAFASRLTESFGMTRLALFAWFRGLRNGDESPPRRGASDQELDATLDWLLNRGFVSIGDDLGRPLIYRTPRGTKWRDGAQRGEERVT